MNIYLRKILKHDITHQISITQEVLKKFFCVNSENQSAQVEGKKSGSLGNVTFLPATDARLGGDIKRIIANEGGMEEGDILLFIKNKGKYDLEVLSRSDERHKTLSSIMGDDRHLIVNVDDNNLRRSKKIDKPYQRIFFGAPGTGKSFELNKEAEEYFGKNNYERVTFHPNYMYGNFVGSFKPFVKILKTSEGSIKKDADGNIQESITYEYIPGLLIKQLIKALKNENENYLLIIEEINRANVTAVFGDVFQLLDRSRNGQSEYFIETSKELQVYLKKEFDSCELSEDVKKKLGSNFNRLYLPSNFYIWATMNSADQGVMPIDTAFRRRWEFKYLGIDEAADKNLEEFKKYKFKINSTETVNWDEFRRELNKRLSTLNIPEDKLIGPYFVSKSILEDENLDRLTEVIKNKVLMYLYEDAAKAYRPSLFADGKFATYSSVCKNFDENALSLFKQKLEIETEILAHYGSMNKSESFVSEDDLSMVAENIQEYSS